MVGNKEGRTIVVSIEFREVSRSEVTTTSLGRSPGVKFHCTLLLV